MAELLSLADILVMAPCRAGKNTECINAGLTLFNLGVTSLVILKYGSCRVTKKNVLIDLCTSSELTRFYPYSLLDR